MLTSIVQTVILSFYTSSILMTTVSLSSHISVGSFVWFNRLSTKLEFQNALHDFFQAFVSETDLHDVLLPAIEKALLRSPEFAMSGESPTRNESRDCSDAFVSCFGLRGCLSQTLSHQRLFEITHFCSQRR